MAEAIGEAQIYLACVKPGCNGSGAEGTDVVVGGTGCQQNEGAWQTELQGSNLRANI